MKNLLLCFCLALPLFCFSQTDANKVYCAGQTISITTADTFAVHHWYKVVDGTTQAQTQTGKVYTEIPTNPGYYNYQLTVESAGGCLSQVSDVFKVYVLPALTVSITSPIVTICSVPTGSVLLTANVPTGFTYNYQWTRNGTIISGATGSTYNVSGESTAGNIAFGVNVSYVLNGSCTYSATKNISIVAAPTKPVIQ